MVRISPVAAENTTERAQTLLDSVRAKLGMTPNMMSTLANSPASLEGYLKFSSILGGGLLTGKLREQIALTIAQANGCDYCLSAHTALGKSLGLSASQINDARRGTSEDSKSSAALKFAARVLEHRGAVSDADLAAARAADLSDAEIVEVVANTALNVLTNYLNRVAQTEIDFPVAPELVEGQNSESCGCQSETCSA